MRANLKQIFPVLAALLLVACGGASGVDSGTTSGAGPARGTLLQRPPQLVSLAYAPELLSQLNALAGWRLLASGTTAVCDVAVYHIR